MSMFVHIQLKQKEFKANGILGSEIFHRFLLQGWTYTFIRGWVVLEAPQPLPPSVETPHKGQLRFTQAQPVRTGIPRDVGP